MKSSRRARDEIEPSGLIRLLRKSPIYITLVLMSAPFVFPFWWMVSSSFKSYREMFTFPPSFLPHVWEWDNYSTAFSFQPFARQYFNSLYIAIIVTAGVLLVSSLSGYAFARIRFAGSSLLFIVLLSSLMMPPEVTIIPNFLFMRALGLIDTHVPLIVIPILGSGGVIGTFIMRQFFLALPKELEDAALIDGLNRWGLYWRVAIPLARPALASVAILTFLNSWNAFLEPLIYLNDRAKFTLPLALRSYTDIYGTPLWGAQLAATVLSVVPVLIFFVLAQQQVVESFSQTGVKG